MQISFCLFLVLAATLVSLSHQQSDCTPIALDLVAGQNVNAGTIDITNSENFFIISFHLHEGWTIQEAHFYVGLLTPDNNPGGYPYHLSSGTYNNSFVWIIDATDFIAPPCGTTLNIALHAVVSDAGGFVETAWSGCNNEFDQGWGSYCDTYIYKCDCEDPEDPNPGDLECCDCDTPGTECPVAQTHRFDVVWGGGNPNNFEENDFADVFITIDIENKKVTLFLEEDPAGEVHQDRYEIKEMQVGVSTEHTNTWPGGFAHQTGPWSKLEFDPPLVILKEDEPEPVIFTFMHTFDFSDFCSINGDFCMNFTETPACESTFYIAVHAAVCVWENCTAPQIPDPDVPCEELPEEETFYGLCPDIDSNSTNCFPGRVWSHAASLEFCCGDDLPPPPPPPNGPCTRTIGYWKTHNKYRTQQSQLIPWPIPDGEDNTFPSCDSTWLEILWEPVRGNKWLILAKQYIGAVLNIAAGTDSTDIDTYLGCALSMLTTHSTDCRLNNKNLQLCGKKVTQLASILDGYNNGVTGPGHCDSDTIFCPDQCFCAPNGGNTTKRSVTTSVTPTVCIDDDAPKTVDLKGFNPDSTQFALIETDDCNPKRVGLHRRVSEEGIITLSFIGKGCCAAQVNSY